MGDLRLWHYSVCLTPGERTVSRVVQVLESQRVETTDIRISRMPSRLQVNCTVMADESKARRTGMLLQRIEGSLSAVWIPVTSDEAPTLPESMAVSLRAADLDAPDMDPGSPFWCASPAVWMERDSFGRVQEAHRTEIRMRWSDRNLYFLFVCNYLELFLRPEAPLPDRPTDRLWEHDVAEIFIAPSEEPLIRYLEFELSPRGEWLDLRIEHSAGNFTGAPAHSGFEGAAWLDEQQKQWVAFFRLPAAAVCGRELASGDRFRVNFFRSQGSAPTEIAWQSTYNESFHIPRRFGILYLADWPS